MPPGRLHGMEGGCPRRHPCHLPVNNFSLTIRIIPLLLQHSVEIVSYIAFAESLWMRSNIKRVSSETSGSNIGQRDF
jgi:hypothetical protein